MLGQSWVRTEWPRRAKADVPLRRDPSVCPTVTTRAQALPEHGKEGSELGSLDDQRTRPRRRAVNVEKRAVSKLLDTPGALLISSHLSELGFTRRAIDALWRACPVVVLPGYKRPMIRVEDYLAYIEEHTYRDDVPRVRPPYEPLTERSPNERIRRRRNAG
jgi:hypothetical protein